MQGLEIPGVRKTLLVPGRGALGGLGGLRSTSGGVVPALGTDKGDKTLRTVSLKAEAQSLPHGHPQSFLGDFTVWGGGGGPGRHHSHLPELPVGLRCLDEFDESHEGRGLLPTPSELPGLHEGIRGEAVLWGDGLGWACGGGDLVRMSWGWTGPLLGLHKEAGGASSMRGRRCVQVPVRTGCQGWDGGHGR